MSPEAQIALAVLELLAKVAPSVWAAMHGTVSPAEVLARAGLVLPAHGSARTKIDALFAEHSRARALIDVFEQKTRNGARGTFVLEAADARALALSMRPEVVPTGTWGEPGEGD